MRIRRYLGYDCDSIDGFNNGHYIDSEPIECASYAEAERLCREALSQHLGSPVTDENSEDIGHGDGPCIEVTTGYFDSKTGDELTEDEFYTRDDENGTYRRYVVCHAHVL